MLREIITYMTPGGFYWIVYNVGYFLTAPAEIKRAKLETNISGRFRGPGALWGCPENPPTFHLYCTSSISHFFCFFSFWLCFGFFWLGNRTQHEKLPLGTCLELLGTKSGPGSPLGPQGLCYSCIYDMISMTYEYNLFIWWHHDDIMIMIPWWWYHDDDFMMMIS